MKNKSFSMPMAMLVKKFYCHECGNRLKKHPRKRTIRRGDPDYRKYNKIGNMRMIGDVELTEYDFKCPSCGKITAYDEQCTLQRIQKQLGKYTLTQAEIAQNMQTANDYLERKRRIIRTISVLVSIALFILILCLQIKQGNISVNFSL